MHILVAPLNINSLLINEDRNNKRDFKFLYSIYLKNPHKKPLYIYIYIVEEGLVGHGLL